jgi:20S proteasome alpha/beta subunit
MRFVGLLLCIHLTIVSSSAIIGLKTSNSVILSSTKSLIHNGIILSRNFDRIHQLHDNLLLGIVGDTTDCHTVLTKCKYVCDEYYYKFNSHINSKALANYCRSFIAQSLRKSRLQVDILIAGCDGPDNIPCLFRIDNIGSLQQIDYGVIGSNSHESVLSLIDKNWCTTAPNHDKGMDIINKCWNSLRYRSKNDVGDISIKFLISYNIPKYK